MRRLKEVLRRLVLRHGEEVLRRCSHTVRTYVRLRAEASKKNRAILSDFEQF